MAPYFDALEIRTSVVSLRFDTADANNRPPTVEIDARYLLVTGVAKAARTP